MRRYNCLHLRTHNFTSCLSPHIQPFQGTTSWRIMHILSEKKKSSAVLLQAREMLLSLTSISNLMCLFSSIHLQTLPIRNNMHCIQPKICTFKNRRICTSFFTAILTHLNRSTEQNSSKLLAPKLIELYFFLKIA